MDREIVSTGSSDANSTTIQNTFDMSSSCEETKSLENQTENKSNEKIAVSGSQPARDMGNSPLNTENEISDRRQVISKKDFGGLKAHHPAKKRVLEDCLRYRGKNLYLRPLKRSRFCFDVNLRPSSLYKDLGPISVYDSPFRSDETKMPASIAGMFDDAEGDQTFDFKMHENPTKPSSAIRADLVEAILGSPPKSKIIDRSISIHPNPISNLQKHRIYDHQQGKRITNKKRKKLSTEKEKLAAEAILDGEIDLLRILPREDCDFLGKSCFIFTLRQLEWVLEDGATSHGSSSNHEAREKLMQNLKKSSIVTDVIQDIQNEDFVATEKLNVWKTLIQTWKQKSPGLSNEGQFPLANSPISIFFPTGTLQFMESINVKTLFDFLCLKKTESGLAVEMFRTWRKKCGLKDLKELPLAKHLIGINVRIEASLKKRLDHEQNFTKFITGSMVVLSGAAKEFLIDNSKNFSGIQFIDTKTKILADELLNWRLKRGLPALKGSGNVAMISAWKTQIKDELEIEKSIGIVIPEEAIRNEIEPVLESEMSIPDRSVKNYDRQSKRKKTVEPTSKPDPNYLEAQEALNSTMFFKECFSDERKLAMFESVGITTAQQLLDAKKGKNSELLKAVIKLKSEQKPGKEIQIPSCVSLLYEWSSRVKRKITEIEDGKCGQINESTSVNKNFKAHRGWSKKGHSTNPFDALSKSSKEFLVNSMNIRTASEFLDARTTDVANAFIKWREEKGKPALKGLGAVASISGWKKLVRIKAAEVGDQNLAELNSSRSTKSIAGGEKSQETEHCLDELKEQLGSVDTSMALNSNKNNFSVLSCDRNYVFHFELETRHNESKGQEAFLRYLGSGSESSFELSDFMNVADENECFAIKPNLSERLDKVKGRKSYDSMTHGTIDLSYHGYNPCAQTREQSNDSGVTLEELIRTFVFQSKPLRKGADIQEPLDELSEKRVFSHSGIKKSSNISNVFEALRNGKKSCLLHLLGPIERGQSVALHYLPLRVCDKSMTIKGNREAIRNSIQDRLQKLPATLLLKVLRFLKIKVAALVSEYCDSALNKAVARRRIHWVAIKIHESLQIISTELASRHISTDLLWTKSQVEEFRDNPGFDMISESIMEEIRHEVEHEFTRRKFDGFSSTVNIWCPLAKNLFNKIINVFATLSTERGDAFFGNNLTVELSSLVSESVLRLKELCLYPQSRGAKDLSDIVLMYKETTSFNSNKFPSFQDIIQNYILQPYEDAMSLCNEPVPSLNSIKEARIVATKRVNESNKHEATLFKDLSDIKINEKTNIDVHWYVDTQILAVAQSAIRCGVYISASEDKNAFIRNNELQVLETARTVLAEDNRACISADEFNIQQRVTNSILQPEVSKPFAVANHSLAKPSSLPFFFGFIWPILRREGWKLMTGNLPRESSFVPPDRVEHPNQLHRSKDSLRKQRLQLSAETSSYGLGYIPRLTKRLLIECSNNDDNETTRGCKVDPETDNPSSSIKVVLKEFASSLSSQVVDLNNSINRSERSKIKEIISELLSLFNKLVPLIFEKDDECILSEGKEWCDVLDCRYLFKLLIIMPSMLRDADIPSQHYSLTISVIQELLTYLSKNHRALSPECLNVPDEEYRSESNFPSNLPMQIQNLNKIHLNLDTAEPSKNEKFEEESMEAICAKDRVNLTDYVAIVMDQTVIGKSTSEDPSRRGQYRVGQPFIVCRHCHGVNGGKYFYGSYESIAAATTVIEKHILRCPEIGNEVKQEVMRTKADHPKQRKKLPFGAQGAFFVRLYDRMQSLSQPSLKSESSPDDSSRTIFSTAEKSSFVKENERATKPCVIFNDHLDVMNHIQSTEPWKSKKELAQMITKYYTCLDYGGELCRAKTSRIKYSSEWLYSRIASM